MIPRYRDTTVSQWQDDWIVATARLLRRPGKESATLRLTSEEKAQLRDVAYTYTRQGRRTTETDLIRIAIHALLEDYQTNGEASALARVMAALEP
jgi:YD repeat-containing protein